MVIMNKKLNIQIDVAGNYRIFVDDEEIATIYNNQVSLIDSIRLSSNNDDHGENHSHVEIVFKNMLGGLWEASHKEILTSMAKAVKILKGLPVELSIRWQLGLKSIDDEEAWLSKYGDPKGLRDLL